MGGINQIINIYSNINRMTDQQKGYGLGIILGIRLPCLRGARAGTRRRLRGRVVCTVRRVPCGVCRAACAVRRVPCDICRAACHAQWLAPPPGPR